MKKILIFTILILISLYIILSYNEESTNQEAPKKATFVKNCLGESIHNG
ncbi:MAG: hypothetical protein RIN55_04785 [Tissierellaceae bacterium]|nr:hypothetical protein [Tissierellaceae bacterium]